jgi:hypothetical protein
MLTDLLLNRLIVPGTNGSGSDRVWLEKVMSDCAGPNCAGADMPVHKRIVSQD